MTLSAKRILRAAFYAALWFVAALALVVVLARFFLQEIVCSINWPDVNVDLSEQLKDTPEGLFPDKTITARYKLAKAPGGAGAYSVDVSGKLFGWPFSALATVRTDIGFKSAKARGVVDLRLNGSALKLHASFDASGALTILGPKLEWRLEAQLPKTQFDEKDAYIASLLSRLKMPDVENLAFKGSVSLDIDAAQSLEIPVPQWNARGRIEALDASLSASGVPIRLSSLRTPFGTQGVAQMVSVSPMFMRADYIEADQIRLENVFASVRATETAFLVTEAGADFCSGELRVYAFFLDPKRLNAGVTLFIDGVNAGEVLSHIKGFRGEATGKLNGKLPLYLKEGRELSFGSAYLQSIPGDTGKLKVYDSSEAVEALALGGVAEEVRDNIAKAIADLDYTVLKLGLTPEGEGKMALNLKLEGSAEREGVAVPVVFEITLHGDIEQLVNTGIKAATKNKRTKEKENGEG